MKETVGDIAVQMTCLQTMALLSIDKACSKYLQKSTQNPLGVICESLTIIDHYLQHTTLAFNTVCNVATNEVFRKQARDTQLINVIVKRVLESSDASELYTSAALALRNLLVDEGMRKTVKSDLVAVVATILEETEDDRTRTAACGILVNIAQDANLAKEMIDSGGFERLQDLLKNPKVQNKDVKKTAVEVMHNLCITASQLDIDTGAVVVFLSSVLDMSEPELQVLALKALSAYSAHCKDKSTLLRTMVETKALEMSLDVGLKLQNKEEQKIALNIICFLGQGKDNSALLSTNADLIAKLIVVGPKFNDSGVIRNILVLFYHISESAAGQRNLVDCNFFSLGVCVEGDDALQAFLGILIRCAQNRANHDALLERSISIKDFLASVKPGDNSQIKQLVEGSNALIQQIEVNHKTLVKQKKVKVEKSKALGSFSRPTNLYPNNKVPP
eukprot:UN23666